VTEEEDGPCYSCSHFHLELETLSGSAVIDVSSLETALKNSNLVVKISNDDTRRFTTDYSPSLN